MDFTGTDLKGFGKGNISLVDFDDIAAVVSVVGNEFSQKEIDRNVKDFEWLAKTAPVHEKIIERVMEKTTIIPMKFCTIFKTNENVKKMLQENYSSFKDNLEKLENKIEVNVKVYFNAGAIKELVKKDMPKVRELEERAAKQPPGAAYLTRQKADVLSKDRVRSRVIDYSKKIFRELRGLAEESYENDLLSKKATGRDMLLNAAFLIKKPDFDRFKNDVERIKENFGNLEFDTTGPFPPYNFVE